MPGWDHACYLVCFCSKISDISHPASWSILSIGCLPTRQTLRSRLYTRLRNTILRWIYDADHRKRIPSPSVASIPSNYYTMFTTIRPAFKQVTRSARSFSTRGPSSNAQTTFMRNTLLGGSALVAVTYALGQRQTVQMDSRTSSTPTTLRGDAPRDSVLNGHTLKEPIHRRDGQSNQSRRIWGKC
jgi:hypothetical protein